MLLWWLPWHYQQLPCHSICTIHILQVALDGSGSFVVCSYSNRSLSIYDFASGKILGQATGHAEVITGVIFLPDCEHIISVSCVLCLMLMLKNNKSAFWLTGQLLYIRDFSQNSPAVLLQIMPWLVAPGCLRIMGEGSGEGWEMERSIVWPSCMQKMVTLWSF